MQAVIDVRCTVVIMLVFPPPNCSRNNPLHFFFFFTFCRQSLEGSVSNTILKFRVIDDLPGVTEQVNKMFKSR